MSEIKSTLDLVMERTRHLSLSAEEKEGQRREDFQKRLQGLLQQYADQAVSADELRDRIAALQTELEVTDGRLVVAAVLGRIDPRVSADSWLDLLADLAPAVRGPLEKVLADYHERRDDLRRSGEKRLREQFADRHGIRGTAVVVNPEKDSEFSERLDGLGRETLTRIESLSPQAA
jgi:hypothetical protein